MEVTVFNPEEGWDDNTRQQGIVIDFITKEEVQRREECHNSLSLTVANRIFRYRLYRENGGAQGSSER